jgi:uncharacterized membrane protein YsdA (DUF1294 family)/cold shock CspA family protein
MRYTGTITTWRDDRGFGFITPEGGGKSVFLHFSAFAYTKRRPVGGERVTYTLSRDERGRSRAESVTYIEEVDGEAIPSPANRGAPIAILLSATFFFALGGSVLANRIPLIVLVVYLILSLITFVVYGQDKEAAKTRQWRTAESLLQFLSLIGGWPGALVAQQVLRHKTRKESFQTVFWAVVFLNCGALGLLVSNDGAAFLRSLTGDGR